MVIATKKKRGGLISLPEKHTHTRVLSAMEEEEEKKKKR
jgi:hypothetical protein